MEAQKFLDILEELGDPFYAGVPDSLLSPFIDAIVDRHGVGDKHIVAANEGSAVGLAVGHYLSTSRSAIVYMQNSGIGNAVNPICSLLHEKVCALPVIFVIGWRGEPGTNDEPQHLFQGEVTLPLLDCLEIPYQILGHNSSIDIGVFRRHLTNGKSIAFVIRKDAITNNKKIGYSSSHLLSREDALELILSHVEENVYICTTGKLSREVFEIRERKKTGHKHDFLTVGSMGHSLMIAHGIAITKPEKKIWCLDGDGAMLMHMGSLAIVGVHHPKNLFHVVINNGAHETVGGLPTVGRTLRLSEIAKAVGYRQAYHVTSPKELTTMLENIADGPVFIEIMCNLYSRTDLSRPTTTPVENKNTLMAFLMEGN